MDPQGVQKQNIWKIKPPFREHSDAGFSQTIFKEYFMFVFIAMHWRINSYDADCVDTKGGKEDWALK